MLRLLFLLTCLVCSVILSAKEAELKSAEAQILADNLKREISATLAEINRLELAERNEHADLSFVLSQPSYSVINFGVIIEPDTRSILSVTPYSNAHALGLKAGDAIKSLRIDGQAVQDFSEGVTLNPGSLIQVEVQRAGSEKLLSLETSAQNKTIPAWSLKVDASNSGQNVAGQFGCGYISVFFTPPTTKYQFPAKVYEVDGESGYHIRETIKLPAGVHSLKVHEFIPENMLPRRKSGIEKAKILDITIEPDKTYHIAAQFEPEKRLNLADVAYWEPVVWKVSESKCRP